MKKLFLAVLFTTGFIAVQAQTDSLQQYAGKYKFPDGGPVTEIAVTVENGLLMASSNMGSTELKPTGTADVFEIVAYGGTATFRKKEGKVSGVQIQVGDINMDGEKSDGMVLKDSALYKMYSTQ